MSEHITLFLTGLPCSGKTTLAKALQEHLRSRGVAMAHVDGDDVRGKLNADLGFSEADRAENLRRIAHVCALFNHNQNHVVASFVAPSESLRAVLRDHVPNVKIIHVDCDAGVCEQRDVKGMYAEARAGKRPGFTGVDAPFEAPHAPDLVVRTHEETLDESVAKLLDAFFPSAR